MTGNEQIKSAAKARPIIFCGPMVRQILNGQKTQTRRVIKPQPVWREFKGSSVPLHPGFIDAQGTLFRSPYGIPGGRVWLRETWAPVDDTEFGGEKWIDYRATPKLASGSPSRAGGWENAPDDAEAIRWRPSIHMPRSASRITLEITDLRAQRLLEIDQEDARAEGVAPPGCTHPKCVEGANMCASRSHRAAFLVLWNELNAKRGFGWEMNPWVWAIAFKVIDANRLELRQ